MHATSRTGFHHVLDHESLAAKRLCGFKSHQFNLVVCNCLSSQPFNKVPRHYEVIIATKSNSAVQMHFFPNNNAHTEIAT